MQNVNIVFNANANFSDLIAEVRRVNTELAGLNTQMLGLDARGRSSVLKFNRDFAETLKLSGQFDTSIVTASSNIEAFGKNLDSGRLRLRDYYRAWKTSASSAQGEVRKLAEQQVRLERSIVKQTGVDARGRAVMSVFTPKGLDLSKQEVVSAVNQKQVQIFNEMIKKGSTELINWGKNTQWAGRQLTVGLTVPLTIFAGTAATAFRKVDEQLVRLAKVYGDVGGATQQQIDLIKKQAVDLGRSLAAEIGAPLEQTLGLAADIAATGKTGEELMKSVAETTRLAVLGEVDRQDAMKATLSLQTAFKLNTQELTESINFLNAVENQTSASLSDLVEAIPKAGPVIRGMGGDIKDLALFMTAMREGGINASEGANALKSALAKLINPTKVTREMLQGFGIDLTNIVEQNAGDVVGLMMELKGALDQLDPLSKQKSIEQIFGAFQYSRLSALLSNLGAEGSQTLQVFDLMKASTEELAQTADRELKVLTESASGRFNRQMQSLKANLAGIGEGFLPAFTMALELVNKLIEGFNSLPSSIKNVLNTLGGLVAIAGPIIMLAGVFGNFFGYLIKGMGVIKRFITGTKGFQLVTSDTIAMASAADRATIALYDEATAMGVLRTAANSLTRQLQGLITAQNTMASGSVVGRGFMPTPRRYNVGVFKVPGTGNSDTVPAMLTPGESVIPKDMTQRYAPLINAMINGEIPGYQTGRRPPYWDATKRNEILNSLKLTGSEKLRLPLTEEEYLYSLSAILAPKSVNTSRAGMTKEFLQSNEGRVRTFANIQTGLESLGLSAERTSEVLNKIRPQISTAIDNFDGSIKSWQTGTQIAMRELETSVDISPAELGAIRSRFAPTGREDYPVRGTPVYEVGRRRGTLRYEGRTSSPLYQRERAAEIARQQGYSSENLVLAHMPGYERIMGDRITDPALPTVKGKQLTQQQLDIAIPARNEFQLFRDATANSKVQGNQIGESAVIGLEKGTKEGIQSSSPAIRFMKLGEDAADGAATGFLNGLTIKRLDLQATEAGKKLLQTIGNTQGGSRSLLTGDRPFIESSGIPMDPNFERALDRQSDVLNDNNRALNRSVNMTEELLEQERVQAALAADQKRTRMNRNMMGLNAVGMMAMTAGMFTNNPIVGYGAMAAMTASNVLHLTTQMKDLNSTSGKTLPIFGKLSGLFKGLSIFGKIGIVGLITAITSAIFELGRAFVAINKISKSFTDNLFNNEQVLSASGNALSNYADKIRTVNKELTKSQEELKAFREAVREDAGYKNLVNAIKQQSLPTRMLGVGLSDQEIVQRLNYEYNLMIATDYKSEDAKEVIAMALKDINRTDLIVRVDFSATRESAAIRNIFDGFQEQLEQTRGGLGQGIIDSFKSLINFKQILRNLNPLDFSKDLVIVEERLNAVTKELGFALQDVLSDFTEMYRTGTDVNEIVNKIKNSFEGIGKEEYDAGLKAVRDALMESNDIALQQDKVLLGLIEGAQTYKELWAITTLNIIGVNTQLIKAAQSQNTLTDALDYMQSIPGKISGLFKDYIKSDAQIAKSATNQKDAIDAQIKALQDKIKLLREQQRVEDNINKLKQLQLNHEKAMREMSASLSEAIAGGDLSQAAALLSEMGAAEENYRSEYAKTKKEIERDNEIAALEKKIDLLEAQKKALDKSQESIRKAQNKTREWASTVEAALLKATQKTGTFISNFDDLNNVIGKKGVEALENLAKASGTNLDKLKKNVMDTFNAMQEGTLKEFFPEVADKLGPVLDQLREARLSLAKATTSRATDYFQSRVEDLFKRAQGLTNKSRKDVENLLGRNMPLNLATTTKEMTVNAQNVTVNQLPSSAKGATGGYVNNNKITPGYASGGYVKGPGTGTSDSIPARLSAGEYVIKASSVKKYGKDALDQLNFGSGGMIPGYPMGGLIPYKMGGIVPNRFGGLGKAIGSGFFENIFGNVKDSIGNIFNKIMGRSSTNNISNIKKPFTNLSPFEQQILNQISGGVLPNGEVPTTALKIALKKINNQSLSPFETAYNESLNLAKAGRFTPKSNLHKIPYEDIVEEINNLQPDAGILDNINKKYSFEFVPSKMVPDKDSLEEALFVMQQGGATEHFAGTHEIKVRDTSNLQHGFFDRAVPGTGSLGTASRYQAARERLAAVENAGGQMVAHLLWDNVSGAIKMVSVHPDYRGQGIASAMYDIAKSKTRISHSWDRTIDGYKFSDRTQGLMPEYPIYSDYVNFFDVVKNKKRLEEIKNRKDLPNLTQRFGMILGKVNLPSIKKAMGGLIPYKDGGLVNFLKRIPKPSLQLAGSAVAWTGMENLERFLNLKYGANQNSSGLAKWMSSLGRVAFNTAQGATAGLPFGAYGAVGGTAAGLVEGLIGLAREGSQYGVKGGKYSTDKGFNVNQELAKLTPKNMVKEMGLNVAGSLGFAKAGQLLNKTPFINKLASKASDKFSNLMNKENTTSPLISSTKASTTIEKNIYSKMLEAAAARGESLPNKNLANESWFNYDSSKSAYLQHFKDPVSDLGAALRHYWSKAYDILVAENNPIVKNMDIEEFFKNLDFGPRNRAPKTTLLEATDFMKAANQAYVQAHGLSKNQPLSIYKAGGHPDPYRDDAHKRLGGYWSLSSKFADNYLKRGDTSLSHLYRAELLPSDFPAAIGQSGFDNEWANVINPDFFKNINPESFLIGRKPQKYSTFQGPQDPKYSDFRGPIKKYSGGYIKGYGMGGPTDDSILARISNGEYIMSANAVKKMGVGFMDRLNSGSINLPGYSMGGYAKFGSGGYAMKYADGGPVDSSSNSVIYNVSMNINNPGASADEIWSVFESRMNQEKRRMGKNKKVVY